MFLAKKLIKKIYDVFLKILLKIIIRYFINKYNLLNTQKRICVPSVNTIGDAIIYYDYVKLKVSNPLIISTYDFPSKNVVPFFFKKKEFIFFKNFFFNFLLNLNTYNRRNLNHYALEILEKNFNQFKYYDTYSEKKDNLNNKFKTVEYLSLKKKDNKFYSLKEHYNLKKNLQKNLQNYPGYEKENEKKILDYFFLKKNKFVCLHIRPYPNNEKISFNKDLETNPRSINKVNEYNLSLRYLIKKNFKIVLMGNKKNQIKLSFKHKNIIHYYKSSKQSVINDLYLVNNCYFYIGSQSGPAVIPSILNKPILHTNYVSFFGVFPSKISLYLPKKFLRNNRLVSFRKFFQSKYYYLENSNDFNKYKIRLIDNSEDEIFHAMMELVNKIEYKNTISTRQKNFIKLLKKKHLLSFDVKILISNYYLKKYF